MNCVLAALLFSSAPIAVPSLRIVKGCSVSDLSADGSALLVALDFDGSPAVWNRTGFHRVSPLKGFKFVRAIAFSGDGSTVGGWCTNEPPGLRPYPMTAFIWTAAGGTLRINPAGLGWKSLASVEALSYDGSVSVGYGFTPRSQVEAFRWTKSRGAVHLGFLDSNYEFSEGQAVSNDGATVGGLSAAAQWLGADTGGIWYPSQAVIWNFGKGPTKVSSQMSARNGVRGFSPSGKLAIVADKDGDYLWPTAEKLPAWLSEGRILSDDPIISGSAPGDSFLWSHRSGLVSNKKVMKLLRSLHLGGLGPDPVINVYSNDLSVVAGSSNSSPDRKSFAWIITLSKGTIQHRFNLG